MRLSHIYLALLTFRSWINTKHRFSPITFSLVADMAVLVLGLYRAAASRAAALAPVAKVPASDARGALVSAFRTTKAAAIQSLRLHEYLFASMLSLERVAL